jgi:HemY protein
MRWLGFFVRLAIVVGLALWLVSQPGTARIDWHGYVVQTSAALLGAAILVLVLVFFQFFKAWRWFRDGPRFWRLNRTIDRIEKGQEQIAKGLVAIAAGDAANAGRLAVRARKLLGATTSTRFLQAQASQLAGDHTAAKEIFRTMTAEKEGAVLGYRGLIMAAVREGNWEEAERLVDSLRRLHPATPWLSLIRFELAARRRNWDEASEALAKAASAKLLDAPRAKRHQAALLVAASDEQTRQGNAQQALQLAEKAMKNAPDWMPAAIALASKQLLAHHVRTARRTIERAWTRAPHPQLAALYQASSKSANSLSVYKHMERLVRANPDHPVSRMALAETALDADLWGEARRNLAPLAASPKATQGVFRLLARLERRESGNEQEAADWLMKAAEAPPDPCWLCTSCGSSHATWKVMCTDCGTFNALEWQTPGIGRNGGKQQLIAATFGTVA